MCAAPFEYRMRRSQNTVDDVKIATLESAHHVLDEIRPFVGKILTPDDADRIAELALNLFWTF